VDIPKEAVLSRFPAPMGLPIMAFRPGHMELAVCGLGYVMVYSYGGEEIARFDMDHRRITAATWTSDGEAIAIGCSDGTIQIFAMSEATTVLGEIYSRRA
jgi:hypothetical protein